MKTLFAIATILLCQISYAQIDENFVGNWYIDSTAEDLTFNVRPSTSEESFVFESDMSLYMERPGQKMKLGSYQFSEDTVQFISEQGSVFLEFTVIQQDNDHMQLNGLQSIAGDMNPRKPTFFLTRKPEPEALAEIIAFSQFGELLYRYMENEVTIIVTSEEDYTIECTNCESFEKTDSENTYLVKPCKGRVQAIKVLRNDDGREILASKRLELQYLPDPVIYFGGSKNGIKISRSSTEISAKYSPEMNITRPDGTEFSNEITRWKIQIGDDVFEGNGSTITDEASEALKVFEGEIVGIHTVTKTPDGIARHIGGAFQLK